MKRILLALLFLFAIGSSQASHIVGGDLHYVHLGGDNYQIILKIYRDCLNSTTDFDDPASIGIFNGGILVQNVEIFMNSAVISDIPANANDPCLIPPTDICVKEAIYTQDIVLPYLPGGYVLSYQRCCRTNALVNADSFDDLGITLTTTIPDHELVGYNSNPDFFNFPPIAICLGSPFVYDHSAFDADGDSIAYEFCTPLLGGGIGQYYLNPPNGPPFDELDFNTGFSADYPVASDPAFNIDPVTGLLTGTPNELGVYVVGVCISEYRDGVLINTTNRDFLFNVVLCGSEVTADISNFEPCLGLTAEFETNSVAADNYFWEFGDPNSEDDFSFEFDPSYTYEEEGDYTVTLHVNVGLECEDSVNVAVSAYEPPAAAFELEAFYCEDGAMVMDYVFTEESNEDYNFYWSFGLSQEPPNSVGEETPLVSYDEPGTYNVTLTVVDSPCQTVLIQPFEIMPFPVALVEEIEDACNGLSFDFENLSQNGNEYQWDFGDPSTTDDISSEESPSYTYNSEGTYTVTLTVDEGTTCEDQYTVDVLAYDPPESNINILDSYCEDGSFIYVFENDGNNSSETIYNWSFDANVEPNGALGQNTGNILFPEAGSYTVSVDVFDDPCFLEDSQVIEVLEAPLALADDQFLFCEGLTIPFVNTSSNADSYLWDFGDGSALNNQENPSYTYPGFGTYDVTLTAINETCEDTYEMQVEVLSQNPILMDYSISVPDICDPSTEISLNWNGEGADEVSWDMGDGFTLEGENATYEYDQLGNYLIEVFAYHELCDITQSEIEPVTIDFFVVDSKIEIPNVFTPNGDEFNKDFRIVYEDPTVNLPIGTTVLDYIESYSMQIFDRWGNKVFDSEGDDQPYWNGKDREEGTYYYIITYKQNCLDDEVQTHSGYLQLMK